MQKLPAIDINAVNAALATKRFRRFVEYVKPDYIFKPFNEYFMERLDAFARGEIKKLMVFMPPQHGKSQLSTRMAPAYILGKIPSKKISISSYSATIAKGFAKDIKNIMKSYEYRQAFPNTKIGREAIVETKGDYSDSSYFFETSKGGFVYGVGRGGSLTSKTIDISIVDDPLKDRAEALSMTVKNGLQSWYNDVVRTRLHNDSQELITLTRWVDDDIAGRLLLKEKDWEVIIFPAIKTEDFSSYDHRQPGEPLFPEKHSLERLLEAKERNEVSFNSLYQQDPKPNRQMLVHPDFVKVNEFPLDKINKWIVGIDYGYNDPTAVVAIGCHENKRYWKPLIYKPGKQIIKDMKEDVNRSDEDKINDVIVKAIHRALEQNNMLKSFCYSEHDKVAVNKLMGKGIIVYLANKSITSGIAKVNEYENYYLETDLETYNEVSQYQFKAIGEVILDEPVDGNDHIMNAGRYAIYTDSVIHKY